MLLQSSQGSPDLRLQRLGSAVDIQAHAHHHRTITLLQQDTANFAAGDQQIIRPLGDDGDRVAGGE